MVVADLRRISAPGKALLYLKLLDHSRAVDWLAILAGSLEEPYPGETLCADVGEDLPGLVIRG